VRSRGSNSLIAHWRRKYGGKLVTSALSKLNLGVSRMALATVELEKTGASAQRLSFPTPTFCVDKALARRSFSPRDECFEGLHCLLADVVFNTHGVVCDRFLVHTER
jgi:hypothetical protein